MQSGPGMIDLVEMNIDQIVTLYDFTDDRILQQIFEKPRYTFTEIKEQIFENSMNNVAEKVASHLTENLDKYLTIAEGSGKKQVKKYLNKEYGNASINFLNKKIEEKQEKIQKEQQSFTRWLVVSVVLCFTIVAPIIGIMKMIDSSAKMDSLKNEANKFAKRVEYVRQNGLAEEAEEKIAAYNKSPLGDSFAPSLTGPAAVRFYEQHKSAIDETINAGIINKHAASPRV